MKIRIIYTVEETPGIDIGFYRRDRRLESVVQDDRKVCTRGDMTLVPTNTEVFPSALQSYLNQDLRMEGRWYFYDTMELVKSIKKTRNKMNILP